MTIQGGREMAVRIVADQIPSNFTDANLKALFEPYGTVLTAMVIKGPIAESLHFGYVEMETREQADRAVAAINARQVGVPPIRTTVLLESQR
jgi:hypothetical protein